MKCIKDELIQRYLDGEVSSQEREMVQSHIRTCEKCACRIEEQQVFIVHLKKQLRPSFRQPIEIPPFAMSKVNKHCFLTNKKYILYATSVACILLLLLLFVHPRKKDAAEFQPLFLLESDFDANKPVSQQDMMIYLIDSEGRIITGE